mmetsp:Transcript_74012/g.192180  ORF Transcript_74012/g.192180 Transcript_74012/m.192180 type:complete len:243 (-) Transcript_74012:47-775(-)
MHAIVTCIWLTRQAQILPLREDEASERVCRCRGRVGWAEDAAAEVLPLQLGVPLHDIVIDRGPRCHKLGAHRHEEAVENVEGALAILLQLAAIEPTTELHQIARLLACCPHLIKLLGFNLEFRTRIHGIESFTLLQDLIPIEAKFLLEFILRHSELVWSQDRGLGSNRVVVLVDLLVFVDLLSSQGAFLLDCDLVLFKRLLNEILYLVGHGMRLDEDEGTVFHHAELRPSRRITAQVGQGAT